jgi:hypothetical protein
MYAIQHTEVAALYRPLYHRGDLLAREDMMCHHPIDIPSRLDDPILRNRFGEGIHVMTMRIAPTGHAFAVPYTDQVR